MSWSIGWTIAISIATFYVLVRMAVTDDSLLDRLEEEKDQYVYEARDITSDDVFHSVGVWLTLRDAVVAINEADEPWTLGDMDLNEYVEACEIELRRRKVGWPTNDIGEVVVTWRWNLVWDKETGESAWCKRERRRSESV